MKRSLFVGLALIIGLMRTEALAQAKQCAGPFAEPPYQTAGSAIAKSIADTATAHAKAAVQPGFGLRLERLREMQTGLIHDFFNQMLAGLEYQPDLHSTVGNFSSRYYRAERETDKAALQTLSAALFACFPELERASTHISATAARERTDQATRRDEAQRQAQQNKEEAVREGQRLFQEAEKKAALERTPLYMLGNSYINYIRIKKCEAVRLGYATVFVSDVEVERSKIAVSKIEQKLVPQLGADETGKLPTSQAIWAKANQVSSNDPSPNRDQCQHQYRSLMERYRTLFPDADDVRKDF